MRQRGLTRRSEGKQVYKYSQGLIMQPWQVMYKLGKGERRRFRANNRPSADWAAHRQLGEDSSQGIGAGIGDGPTYGAGAKGAAQAGGRVACLATRGTAAARLEATVLAEAPQSPRDPGRFPRFPWFVCAVRGWLRAMVVSCLYYGCQAWLPSAEQYSKLCLLGRAWKN